LGRPVGPQADLYSVGVIAYELLVGRVPFERPDTPVAVLLAHVNDPLPDPREIDPELDPRLAAWLERMLAKEPDDRFSGALEAWDALEGIVIEALGPRWRRDARLPEPVVPGEAAPPKDASADLEPEQDGEANEAWAGAWSPTVAPRGEPSLSAGHHRPALREAGRARRRRSLRARIMLMAGVLFAVTAGEILPGLRRIAPSSPSSCARSATSSLSCWEPHWSPSSQWSHTPSPRRKRSI
jgi:serine/threonine protein kinase